MCTQNYTMASFLLFKCQKDQKITLCTQYRYIQYYVERVERLCYVHNIDTFHAMSKGSKDYVMLTLSAPNETIVDLTNEQKKSLLRF